jgi:hypothetical protein
MLARGVACFVANGFEEVAEQVGTSVGVGGLGMRCRLGMLCAPLGREVDPTAGSEVAGIDLPVERSRTSLMIWSR